MKRSEKGTVLVMALLAAVVALLLAAFALRQAGRLLEAERLLGDKLEAELQANSTLQQIHYIALLSPFEANHLAPPRDEALQVPDSIPLDGTPLLLFDSRIRLRDAAAGLSVSNLNAYVVGNLLGQRREKTDTVATLVSRLVDWKDFDDRRRASGAEAEEYRRLGRSALPRNHPHLQSKYEIFLVWGFDEKAVKGCLSPHLHHLPAHAVNINTADGSLLQAALGISPLDAAQLLSIRQSKGTLVPTDVYRITGMEPDFATFTPFQTMPARGLVIEVEAKVGQAISRLRVEASYAEEVFTPYRVWYAGTSGALHAEDGEEGG